MMGAMKVELLYIDGCPSWHVADERLRLALEATGLGDVDVHHVLVSTPGQAGATRFRGSPTVLVDGLDLFPDSADSSAPVGLSCRLYRSGAGFSGAPTVEQLVEMLGVRTRTSGARA
jgi:hypothetical protein